MNANTVDYAITVSGGAGQSNTPKQTNLVIRSARLNNICIKAPNANATYTVTIEDADGYVIYYETPVTGNASLICDRIFRDGIVIKITSASVNGAYSVRLYIES